MRAMNRARMAGPLACGIGLVDTPGSCGARVSGIHFRCWDTQAPFRRLSVQALCNARSSR
jgi:hypothetical protein